MVIYMAKRIFWKNPWSVPFMFLLLIMTISFVMILSAASSDQPQDIRSRAFDDVREVPNGQIPRPTSAAVVSPGVYVNITPAFLIGGTVITGVPASTSAPLLNQTPGPTLSVSPAPRQQPPCNVVLRFMQIPCRVP